VRVRPIFDRDAAEIRCDRCDSFQVTEELLLRGRLTDSIRPYLSAYTRECTERGQAPDMLTTENVERLAQLFQGTPVNIKLDRLLRLLANRTRFGGEIVPFNPAWDYPLLSTRNADEAIWLRSALQSRGYCVVEGGDRASVTFKGWEELGPGSSHGLPRRCFVAMSFDPSLTYAYDRGIAAGIRDAGYDPIRLDRVDHNEKICDRIIVEIRQAKFLVADVTFQRQGVYFEAGYAMALGRPVIGLCREDDLANVHFDTRQYNHIVWNTPEQIRDRLRERILATVGEPATWR
jgi:hypothetical protein